MDWTIKDYEDANHPPVPKLNHEMYLKAKSRERVNLSAEGSTDPDGDNLSFLWFHYPEAGSYKEAIKLGPPENSHGTYGKAPSVDKEESIHIVLKVTDKGEPKLTRYKRVIIKVIP
jgi:hypothetical protein